MGLASPGIYACVYVVCYILVCIMDVCINVCVISYMEFVYASLFSDIIQT